MKMFAPLAQVEASCKCPLGARLNQVEVFRAEANLERHFETAGQWGERDNKWQQWELSARDKSTARNDLPVTFGRANWAKFPHVGRELHGPFARLLARSGAGPAPPPRHDTAVLLGN